MTGGKTSRVFSYFTSFTALYSLARVPDGVSLARTVIGPYHITLERIAHALEAVQWPYMRHQHHAAHHHQAAAIYTSTGRRNGLNYIAHLRVLFDFCVKKLFFTGSDRLTTLRARFLSFSWPIAWRGTSVRPWQTRKALAHKFSLWHSRHNEKFSPKKIFFPFRIAPFTRLSTLCSLSMSLSTVCHRSTDEICAALFWFYIPLSFLYSCVHSVEYMCRLMSAVGRCAHASH